MLARCPGSVSDVEGSRKGFVGWAVHSDDLGVWIACRAAAAAPNLGWATGGWTGWDWTRRSMSILVAQVETLCFPDAAVSCSTSLLSRSRRSRYLGGKRLRRNFPFPARCTRRRQGSPIKQMIFSRCQGRLLGPSMVVAVTWAPGPQQRGPCPPVEDGRALEELQLLGGGASCGARELLPCKGSCHVTALGGDLAAKESYIILPGRGRRQPGTIRTQNTKSQVLANRAKVPTVAFTLCATQAPVLGLWRLEAAAGVSGRLHRPELARRHRWIETTRIPRTLSCALQTSRFW